MDTGKRPGNDSSPAGQVQEAGAGTLGQKTSDGAGLVKAGGRSFFSEYIDGEGIAQRRKKTFSMGPHDLKTLSPGIGTCFYAQSQGPVETSGFLKTGPPGLAGKTRPELFLTGTPL